MKQRVLIVDDDHLVADTLNWIFRANGYESEAVYSAADGLERARTFDPVLLLCDITMPEQNGLELAETVQHEMPQCKLLMLTAYAGNIAKAEQQATRTRRPLKLLSKPCRPELLLREAFNLIESA
ncbi:MAG: response regulator [Acidobacteria bacterium]|nr:response regulator [Acidobacteriota bacterium]